MTKIRIHCKRDINPERSRLVERFGDVPLAEGRSRARLNLTRGSEEKGFIVETSAVRAVLIVLLQHSLVRAIPPPKSDSHKSGSVSGSGSAVKYKYVVDHERAIYLQRFPRYVEYARKTYEEEGATIIEEILVHGRMGTMEIIKGSTECVEQVLSEKHESESAIKTENDGNGDNDDDEASIPPVSREERLVLAQKVADTFQTMVNDGYVELVPSIGDSSSSTDEEAEFGEAHYENSQNGTGPMDVDKETKHDDVLDLDKDFDMRNGNGEKDLNSVFISILKAAKYKKTFQPGAVWRVNYKMFHASLRSFFLGRLVAERYGQVLFSGAIVSAALKYTAAKEFAPRFKVQYASDEDRQRFLEEKTIFTPNDIMEFLPSPILAELKNKAGGARTNLSSTLTSMAKFNYPPAVVEVEEAQGHPDGGKFEIATRQLLSYLKGRILHQVVKDHHGDVAARICSILEARGHLEGDTISDSAMVPAKDAREILHRLYKDNYISMLYLQQSKQHNPANAMYLWCVDKKRISNTVLMNVCRALYNFRLRRQHEVQVGKDWIERAKFADDTDENYSEVDKANYNKFCQGLERIDNACIQLDETLMVLKDFESL